MLFILPINETPFIYFFGEDTFVYLINGGVESVGESLIEDYRNEKNEMNKEEFNVIKTITDLDSKKNNLKSKKRNV